MRKKSNLPSIAEAREMNPPVDPGEALRKDLRMAFLESISSKDMECLAEKLKSMALGGDLKAIQLLTTLLVAQPAQGTVVQQGVIVGGQGQATPPKLSAAEFRADAARLIRLEGPLNSQTLGERMGCPAIEVTRRLGGCDWFEEGEHDHMWHLTGQGFAEINAYREVS